MENLRQIIQRKRKGEGGSALVAVLCLVFLGGMLAAAVSGMTLINTMDIAAHVETQRSFYVNEGVMNRVQWWIAADRNIHTAQETLGDVDYSEYDYDRFLQDGVIHEVDYYGTMVRVRVFDAISGWDLSSSNYKNTLRSFTSDIDTEQDTIDLVNSISARITDYIDSDDNIVSESLSGTDTAEGMEVDDYDSEGMSPLPRNADMQFREELFYIKDFTSLIPVDKSGRMSSVRLIPPPNTVYLTGTPSFFSAPPEMIRLLADLEDEELENVVAVREKFYKERTLLSEELEEGMPAKLQQKMAWTGSDYYTVTIEPAGHRPSRRLTASFTAFGVTGPTDEILEYLEWISY